MPTKLKAEDMRTREIEMRSLNESNRTCDFVASTDTVDSYGEIVDQSWDLGRFNANPVILYAHNRSSLPIGRATRCEVVNGQLECTIEFATAAANPMAEQIWQLVRSKMLRAVSVGFIPGKMTTEYRPGFGDVVVLRENKLREISVVTLPANPDALAKSLGGRSDRQTSAPSTLEELKALNLPPELYEEARAAMIDKISNDFWSEPATGEGQGDSFRDMFTPPSPSTRKQPERPMSERDLRMLKWWNDL